MPSKKRNKHVKNTDDYVCAYVYLYINKYNLKTYIGFRYAFEGNPFDDFNNNYNSSCTINNDEFWAAMENGELEWEILAVFIGKGSAERAHKLEVDLIRFTYETYGADNIYNGHIENDEFIYIWTDKRREQRSNQSKEYWDDPLYGDERREQRSNQAKEYWKDDSYREKCLAPLLEYSTSPEYKEIRSNNAKEVNSRPKVKQAIGSAISILEWVTDKDGNSFRVPTEETQKYINDGGYLGRNTRGMKRPESAVKATADKLRGVPKSEDSKLKNRLSHLGKYDGEKNPSFGKKWITDGINKDFLPLEEALKYIEEHEGWRFGQPQWYIDKCQAARKKKKSVNS